MATVTFRMLIFIDCVVLCVQMLILRLRDSVMKMGEELEKAADSEAREKENAKYYQIRMEEMKADMNELMQREMESSRRRVELVSAYIFFLNFLFIFS